MNNITITGNLGKDNELKQLGDGKSVLNNSVAVRRSFKNKQGEYETDWFNISLFGKSAEIFSQYTRKGSKVGIVGRLEFRQYENGQGQNVTTHDLKVTGFDFLDSKNEQSQQTNQGNQSNQYQPQTNQNTPQYQYGQPDYEKIEGHPIDISRDDLPF